MESINVYRNPCTCSTDATGTLVVSDDCSTGDQITNALILTEDVAIAKGVSEINANESDRVYVSGTKAPDEFILAGTQHIFTDPESGDYPCVVLSSSLSLSRTLDGEYTADLALQLEREE